MILHGNDSIIELIINGISGTVYLELFEKSVFITVCVKDALQRFYGRGKRRSVA